VGRGGRVFIQLEPRVQTSALYIIGLDVSGFFGVFLRPFTFRFLDTPCPRVDLGAFGKREASVV